MTEAAHSTSSVHRRLVLGGMALGLAVMLLASLAYRLGAHPLTHAPAVPVASSASASAPAMPPEGMTMPPAGAPAASGTGGDAGAVTPEQAATIAAMQKLQADPNDVDALLDLADLFMQQGSPESAQGFINRALVAAPGDARPSYYQGVLDARRGKYPEAAEAMTRSLRLQDNPAVRYSLAVVYRYHLNDDAKAKEQLEAARANPDLTPDLRTLIEQELAKQS